MELKRRKTGNSMESGRVAANQSPPLPGAPAARGSGPVPTSTSLAPASAAWRPRLSRGTRASPPPRPPAVRVATFFNSAKPACVFLLIPGPPRPRPAVPLCRWCASGHLSRRPRGDPASHRLSNGRLACELSGATGRTVVLPRPPITGHLAPRVTRRRPHMADVSRLEHVSCYYDRNSSKLERCLCFN